MSHFFQSEVYNVAFFAVEKEGSKLGSAVEATTNLMILHKMKMDQFRAIGWSFLGMPPTKYWPVTRLRARVSER